MSTHSRYERFVPLCLRALKHFWPDHPELLVFSDLGRFDHPGKVISPAKSWVGMMSECLATSLRQGKLSEDEHVLLLLEDHIPHGPVDGRAIEWFSQSLRLQEDTYVGLFEVDHLGAGRAELVSKGDEFALHRFELPNFSSLHPAVWSVRHLRRTLELAKELGRNTPWRFEYVRMNGVTHYLSGEGAWDSPHGGFLYQGMVNVPSLRSMREGPLRNLRRRLLWRLVPEVPGRLARRLGDLGRSGKRRVSAARR